MLTAETIIVTLKVAVVAVTLLLIGSLLALARGNYRLHGRINLAFAALSIAALLGLEVLARFVNPQLFDYFDADTLQALRIHLCFSVPAAVLLPVMLYTGLTHRRRLHIALAILFSLLWAGTFITGVFWLPHW